MTLKSIYISEELHRQAKLYAIEQGKKLSFTRHLATRHLQRVSF